MRNTENKTIYFNYLRRSVSAAHNPRRWVIWFTTSDWDVPNHKTRGTCEKVLGGNVGLFQLRSQESMRIHGRTSEAAVGQPIGHTRKRKERKKSKGAYVATRISNKAGLPNHYEPHQPMAQSKSTKVEWANFSPFHLLDVIGSAQIWIGKSRIIATGDPVNGQICTLKYRTYKSKIESEKEAPS